MINSPGHVKALEFLQELHYGGDRNNWFELIINLKAQQIAPHAQMGSTSPNGNAPSGKVTELIPVQRAAALDGSSYDLKIVILHLLIL